MDYGGARARQSDLFGTQAPQDVSAIKKRLFKVRSLPGVVDELFNFLFIFIFIVYV